VPFATLEFCGMALLVIGLVIFLGIHSVSIVAPAWRNQMAARNERAWKGAYSAISLASFALLVYGYGLARLSPVVLYAPPASMRHLTLLLMVPVFPLLFAAYLPGRIKTITKHPMLIATKLWALAHLLSNGSLADVLLFGGFLAWAVADRISLKRRAPRPVPALPASPLNDVIVVVAGLAAYVAMLLWVHRWLIGVSPLQ
jgi:uncharacterized membrane protein